MRPVEDSHLSEENDGQPASFSLADLGSQLDEEGFDVPPLDVGARRVGKDGFEGPPVRVRGRLLQPVDRGPELVEVESETLATGDLPERAATGGQRVEVAALGVKLQDLEAP